MAYERYPRGYRRGREGKTEVVAQTANVHLDGCTGCVAYDREFMLSFMHDGVHPVHGEHFIADVFLTRELAEGLRDKLNAALARTQRREES